MTADSKPLVPAAGAQQTITIRKSRFIAQATRVTSRAGAMTFIDHIRQDHPDARHHCWAYLLGDHRGSASASMNDDGEPAGTAGKPILNVIQHKAIGDVIVVVTRYFGGIKLGAGGLVRAYAGACEAVLSDMPLRQHTPLSTQTLRADFPHEQPIRHWCAQHGADIVSVAYSEQVTLTLAVPENELASLNTLCRSHGIEQN